MIVEVEEAQKCVLKSAFEVFKQDSQMLSIVVDLLLKYQIVECASVANWVFTKEMQPEFMKYFSFIISLEVRLLS